jgi:hypothetical protein
MGLSSNVAVGDAFLGGVLIKGNYHVSEALDLPK